MCHLASKIDIPLLRASNPAAASSQIHEVSQVDDQTAGTFAWRFRTLAAGASELGESIV